MDFHATCECRLIRMEVNYETLKPRYDIMSNNEHVGRLYFCPILEEWVLHLQSHVGVTHAFITKIWSRLKINVS